MIWCLREIWLKGLRGRRVMIRIRFEGEVFMVMVKEKDKIEMKGEVLVVMMKVKDEIKMKGEVVVFMVKVKEEIERKVIGRIR